MNNKATGATVLSLRDMQELVTVKQVADCLQVSKGTIGNVQFFAHFDSRIASR